MKHLRAIVGFSMGAEQAFQWAVSHPDFMDAIVATVGTAKCYGHGFVRLEGQIAALIADPAWQGGDYASPPSKGLEAPIPSLWGQTAGAASNPADLKFLNENIAAFLNAR